MSSRDPDAVAVGTTMSLRLNADTTSKLATLARHTGRTRSVLATAAIAAYVERELAIIEGIERGLADMQAGRVTSHREAMSRLRETIARARHDR